MDIRLEQTVQLIRYYNIFSESTLHLIYYIDIHNDILHKQCIDTYFYIFLSKRKCDIHNDILHKQYLDTYFEFFCLNVNVIFIMIFYTNNT